MHPQKPLPFIIPLLGVLRNASLSQVDINGDGKMEWDEFSRFVVMKAQQHRAQMSIDQLAEYRQGSRQARMIGDSMMMKGVAPLFRCGSSKRQAGWDITGGTVLYLIKIMLFVRNR